MSELMLYFFAGAVAAVFSLLAFLFLVWVGFRMGRATQGQPTPPILPRKETVTLEEDPYHEPMYGAKQERIPTVE